MKGSDNGRISLLSRLWGLRKPRRLASVLLRRLHLSHWIVIETNGIRLRFFPAVWMLNLWENRDFGHDDIEILTRWLRPGDVFVDCGANVGLLTNIAAKCVGPAGRVYAVEAHPRIFRYLQSNVELNAMNNVELYHVAVGEKEGLVSFSDSPLDDYNHVVPAGAGIAVPVKRLDSIVPSGTAIRLLKLDVEGYEKFALEGAGSLLQTTEAVYFESFEVLFARYNCQCSETFDLLRQHGFVIVRAGDDGILMPLPDGYVSRQVENLIAVRDLDNFIGVTGYRRRSSAELLS